jgi:hypothetical protein
MTLEPENLSQGRLFSSFILHPARGGFRFAHPSSFILSLLCVLQVPAPAPSPDVARELEAARRAIIARDAAELKGLCERLLQHGDLEAAAQVKTRLPRTPAPDGPTRLVPLPEVVGPSAAGQPAAEWRTKLTEMQSRVAGELFALAQRAAKAKPPRYALASTCLRGVVERQPDHREARRLLGYVPHQGGWATPFAVRQEEKGLVNHPVFGWVPADWVPHLDRGELPAPLASRQNKPRWLPAAEADRLRADWTNPWQISTEHFDIHADVALADAISFGRRLEAFHDLFMTVMADVLGENLPLIRRFKDPAVAGDGPVRSRPHQVYYFRSKDEYIEHLVPKQGPEIAKTLGFYDPPKSGRSGRAPAYFFHDPGGQLPVTDTLYHEVSHQLLFETAGPNAYTRNAGNYWVFEGLGTYFETVSPQPDGSLEVGGFVGRRLEEAAKSLVDRGRVIPLAHFVELDQNAFNRADRIYLHYQEAIALAVFLMQWHDGFYRDAFLDYVRDAYRGRIKRATGRSLQDRLGEPYATLESQFLAFLKNGRDRLPGAEPAAAKPQPGGAIRTVPSR